MCAMSTMTTAPVCLRNRRNPWEVDRPGIGARADNDHLRLSLVGKPLHLLVVDPLIVPSNTVRDDRVELSRKIQRMTVREVSAMREVHPKHRVARLQQRQIHRHVRLCARVRLHVGVLGAKQLLRARDGQ